MLPIVQSNISFGDLKETSTAGHEYPIQSNLTATFSTFSFPQTVLSSCRKIFHFLCGCPSGTFNFSNLTTSSFESSMHYCKFPAEHDHSYRVVLVTCQIGYVLE